MVRSSRNGPSVHDLRASVLSDDLLAAAERELATAT
jgi:hypothetical protein